MDNKVPSRARPAKRNTCKCPIPYFVCGEKKTDVGAEDELQNNYVK